MPARRRRYDEIVESLESAQRSAQRPMQVAYGAKCSDPVCRTVVKALFEGGQGRGWSLIWALNIIALDPASFDDLYCGQLPGNALSAIESAIDGWETDDEADLANATVAYRRMLQLGVPPTDMTPPTLMIAKPAVHPRKPD